MTTKKNLAKVMLMSILTAVTTFTMTACSSDDDLMDSPQASENHSSTRQQEGGSTVLVYMAGRNNLYKELDSDLEEIKVGSKKISDNDNLIVFVRRFNDNNQAEQPWVARIRHGEVTDSVSVADIGITCDDPRACDPEVMEKVMSYAYKHYPATKDYGLVLWSHGSGWLMKDEVCKSRGAQTLRPRAFGVDYGPSEGGAEKWINIPTMRNILEKMPHLKFIMCDCCNMMCLENLYELRHTTDYMIGSVVEIPANGAPYDQILPDMFKGGDFYKQIVDKYYAFQGNRLPLSVVKMSEMDHVASATREVMPTVKASIGEGYADMTGYVHYYNLYDYKFLPEYNIYYDAGEFIMNHVPQADYKTWKQALDKAVVYKKMTDTGWWQTDKHWNTHYSDFTITEEKYHGVSMFVPQDPRTGCYASFNEDIKQMEWYDAVKL